MACSEMCGRPAPQQISRPPIPYSLYPTPGMGESDMLKISKQELASFKQQLDQLLSSQVQVQEGLRQMTEFRGSQEQIQSMLTKLSADISSMKSMSQAGTMEREQSPSKLTEQKPKSPKTGGNASGYTIRVQERRIKRLTRIFEVDEMKQADDAELAKVTWSMRMEECCKIDSLKKMNQILDTAILFVICLNGIFLGVSIDRPEHDDTWFIVDCIFSMCFFLELGLKTYANGFHLEFCGEERWANCFDACLIILDLTQLFFTASGTDMEGPSMSLFRLVRLGRFLRFIRLCRTEMFKDLLGMIRGLMSGMLTLVWAIVLFGMLLYVASLVCRELLGRKTDKENIYEYFNTVPRSMFTVFRCSFGDCSTAGGTPIFEWVTDSYGGVYGLCYCIFVFLMTIGLFNVISAIFVDSTMAAAAELAEIRRLERLSNEKLMSCAISKFIEICLLLVPEYRITGMLSKGVDNILQINFPRHIIDEAIMDPVAIRALHDLDIDPHDHDKLSDILDPDHTGTMSALDIVNGLQRLRGQPRRSDIVSVQLMIRSLQDMVEEIYFQVKQA